MNIYYSQILSKMPVKHGFATKKYSNSEQIYFPKQNHTNKVIINDISGYEDADATITTHSNITIGVKTADCVPILMYEKNKHIAAVVHAGWQGTAGSIVRETVMKIVGLGGSVYNIMVCIGPSIGACCYDVPDDRTSFFKIESITRSGNKNFLNLKKENTLQMYALGIPAYNIEVLPYCTSCRSDTFYSYRKGNKSIYQSNISYIELN